MCCCHAATLLGCLPNNFLAVNAGSKLGELKSFSDLYDYKIILAGDALCHSSISCSPDVCHGPNTQLRLEAMPHSLHMSVNVFVCA